MSVLIALMAQAATVANPPLFELPRQFWGEYNEVLADCGTGRNDTRLRISWNTVQFYESTGEIKELLRQPDGSIIIVAKHSGEGETWQSVYRLRLSDDTQSLTVTHPQTAEMAQFGTERRRCPTVPPRLK